MYICMICSKDSDCSNMNCKQEDDDGGILNVIELNDSFIPGNIIGSFQQPEPRLSIRKPQDINQKASNTASKTRRRSGSSSPEIQYERTVLNTKPTHSKAKNIRRELQRQDSSLSQTEVNFQGFPTRYSRMKLMKASLRSSSDGMMSYMNINRDVMLSSWERTLKPNIISGNSNNGFRLDESWSPQAPEFPEKSNGNERLRHPSQSSSTVISPQTEFSPSDSSRNPFSNLSTSSYYNSSPADPRLIYKNQGHVQSINSSSPLWNPDPPQPFTSPPSESRIPLRNPDPPPPPTPHPPPPPPPPPPPSFRPPSPPYDPRSDLRNPDPPQSSFRLPSPPFDPRSDLRNPDPPQSSFRKPSPPYDSRSDLRNPDPPQASFRQLSPRNPDRPHFNFQASYENRTCLTNPDPPQYLSQPSLENAISFENRNSFTNPDPPQFNSQSSHEKNVLHEESRITNNGSIESMINIIRNNEISKENSFRRTDSIDFREDSIDKQCSIQQPIHTDNQISEKHEEPGNLVSMTINETIDLEIARRCPVYMKGLKCHKGEYCEKLHRLPRLDEVPCMYFKGEGCRRTASDCWFWHPGEKVNEFVINDDAPALVPSMGDVLGYIRKEQAVNPDKYKSKIIPTNEITQDKVVIPAAVGNANHTPLGQRQITRLDSNYSPLLPHLKMANSTNIGENSSKQELSPPSTESNTGIILPSNDLVCANSTENSSIEVSRIKLSRPAKVGAPRKRGVEIMNNDSNSLVSLKIPKKNSVKEKSSSIVNETITENSKTLNASKNIDIPKNQSSQKKNSVKEKSSSIVNETITENSKTLKTSKNIDIPKNQSSQKNNSVKEKSSSIVNETVTENSKILKTSKNIDITKNLSSQRRMEKIIKTVNSQISNDTAKDNLIKSNVNNSTKNKSNRTSKNDQSSKVENKEKEKSKKSNETNAQTKRKARIISESEEESTVVNETKEKMQGKKSKMTNKKSNRAKRSRIESSEESDEDSSQTLVSANEILASSSDETMSEKGSKKSSMPSKKLKRSDRGLSVEGAKEDTGTNVIKKIKSKSSNGKEEILSKPTIKHNKKGNELKKSIIESDKVSKEKNSKSVITKDNKLKSGAQGKEKILTKNSKNSTKRINKPRKSRIESSSESETEAPPTSATNDAKSDSNIMSEEQNAKNKDNPKITKIKVEKEENKKPIIIEEICLLSDSDEENDTVVKSETFLSEEVNEINAVRENKAMDDILWGIDKELENLEEGSGGNWKRTPNHIEKDLYEIISQLEMEKFEDSKYPDIYNLDINYRQLFLKLSNIDNDVQKHALLCKIRYPNCKNIPKDHVEDMSCCR